VVSEETLQLVIERMVLTKELVADTVMLSEKETSQQVVRFCLLLLWLL
jgi:hypothetical protein